MVLRTGPVSREQWKARIEELLNDINKETAEFADEIFEMLVNMTLEMKDQMEDTFGPGADL